MKAEDEEVIECDEVFDATPARKNNEEIRLLKDTVETLRAEFEAKEQQYKAAVRDKAKFHQLYIDCNSKRFVSKADVRTLQFDKTTEEILRTYGWDKSDGNYCNICERRGDIHTFNFVFIVSPKFHGEYCEPMKICATHVYDLALNLTRCDFTDCPNLIPVKQRHLRCCLHTLFAPCTSHEVVQQALYLEEKLNYVRISEQNLNSEKQRLGLIEKRLEGLEVNMLQQQLNQKESMIKELQARLDKLSSRPVIEKTTIVEKKVMNTFPDLIKRFCETRLKKCKETVIMLNFRTDRKSGKCFKSYFLSWLRVKRGYNMTLDDFNTHCGEKNAVITPWLKKAYNYDTKGKGYIPATVICVSKEEEDEAARIHTEVKTVHDAEKESKPAKKKRKSNENS